MAEQNPAVVALAALTQFCVEYAATLPPATRQAVIESAQKYARIVNDAIKDEPDVGNNDQ